MAKPILRLKIDVTKISKEHLFKGEGKKHIINEILTGPINTLPLRSMSPVFENLVTMLVDRDYNSRLKSAPVIVRHKFFDPPYVIYKPPLTFIPASTDPEKDKRRFR